MLPRWPPKLMMATLLGAAGCAQVGQGPEYSQVVQGLHDAAPSTPRVDPPRRAGGVGPRTRTHPCRADRAPSRSRAYIGRALAENRMVQAARANVLAMRARIPQVMALDDPVVSNTILPHPRRGPPVFADGLQPI